jgi:hypothetical protein
MTTPKTKAISCSYFFNHSVDDLMSNLTETLSRLEKMARTAEMDCREPGLRHYALFPPDEALKLIEAMREAIEALESYSMMEIRLADGDHQSNIFLGARAQETLDSVYKKLAELE